VQTLTGSYSTTHTDLSISGRGPSPTLSRTYNSNDSRFSALGQGWTHSYNIYLARPQNGSGLVILVGPEGRSDRYTPNADGTYTPPLSVDIALRKNSDSTYTATQKDQTTWNFDVCGRLNTIKDRYGNTSTLTYNSVGQLTSVSDPAGRGSLTFSYDITTKRLTSVTDWQTPSARRVSYGYDTSGRLQTVTDRNNKQTTFAYDGSTSHLTTMTDPNAHVEVTNHYSTTGQVDWQRDAAGNQTNFSYVVNADGTATTSVTYPTNSFDGSHGMVTDNYDTRGTSATSGKDWLLSEAVQPTSGQTDTTAYTYTAAGFLATIQDPRGNTTTLCWDTSYTGAVVTGSLGNLTRRIDTAVTDARNGHSVRPVTLLKYDTTNNLLERVSPDGVNSTSSTGCSDNLSSFNTQSATDFSYDASGVKLLSMVQHFTDPDNGSQTATTQYQYNDSSNPGRITGIVSPRNNATSLTYFGPGNSQAGLLQSVTDPLTHKSTYTYDSVGRRLTMVDAVGNSGTSGDHTWTWAYDNEDRVTSMQAPQPSGSPGKLTTSFQYDSVGNKLSVTDPKSQITRYLYGDPRNLVTEVDESATTSDPNSDPNKIVTTYAYDNLGNLARLTRAKGSSSERATDYQYDGKSRQRKEIQYTNWPSTSGQLVTALSYDGDNNLTSRIDPQNQTIGFGFDVLNRLTSKTYTNPAPGTSSTANATYGYDLDGVRKSMADGTGTTTYNADELDRLTSVASPGSKTVGYRYDLDGDRRKMIYPDSTAVTYAFDSANRMQSLTDWANRTTSYTYYPDNRLNQVTNFNGATATYTYDEARRLTVLDTECLAPACPANVGTESKYTYTLDAAGNHTTVDEDLQVPGFGLASNYYAYTFDNLSRLTYANAYYGTTSYSYDPAGNRQSRVRTISGTPTTITYSYNTADQLGTVTTNGTPAAYPSNANGDLTGRAGDTLTYDQADRLTQAVVGGLTTTDTYDGDGNRVAHTGEQFGSAAYINDVNRSLPVMLDDGALKYVWGANGLVYDVSHDGTVIEVHHEDGLSTTRVVTDASGTPLDSYVIDEGGVPTSTTGASTQPIRYTGEPRDEVPGLSFLRSRYYDPFLGRFLTRDALSGTASRPMSLNRYSYAWNNPVSATDPNGTCVEDACLLESAALVAACAAECPALVEEAEEGAAEIVPIAGEALATAEQASPELRDFLARNSKTGVAVYQYAESGVVKYVGITNDLIRRQAEHLADPAKRFEISRIPGLSNLTSAQARAVEQVLINRFGFQTDGGTLVNKVNSIAPARQAVTEWAIREGQHLLEQVGYDGG
jgi:RHS repeat-associated protein